MSDPILPFEVWDESTEQNSAPANTNSLRLEILNGLVISESTDAQPGSPSDGDIYIITGAATGAQWSTFDQYDLTIFKDGTWYAYAPVAGIVVNVAGVLKRWTGSAYTMVPTLTALGVSAYMQTLLDDATALAARNTLGVSPRYRFHAWTECTQGGGDGVNFSGAGTGTGATRNVIANASTNEFGVIRWMSGTTASGRNNLTGAVNLFPILLGQGVSYLYVRQAVPTLSTGTETFTLRWGFIDSVTGESTNGVFFRYTDGVNSGKWQAVTRSGGVETATDTGVTEVANTFRKFEITINAAATSVEFKIDGVVVATNTTNIPSGVGKDVTYGGMSLKSAGTTSVAMCDIDTAEATVDFTTPR